MKDEGSFSIFPKHIYKNFPYKDDRRNKEIDNIFKYNEYSYAPFINRNEFARDSDRILFSRAFRRLEHKAQIYSHEKGDHFRTRLTHTLEVLQIARSITKYLYLNEDLVEAITLGHDIGHTPFGHQGERVLDDIMSGESDLNGQLKYKIDYGGFKHNFNSLRVLDLIERKYDTTQGLNLTWQVLEGILKHTRITRTPKSWDIDKFILHDSANMEFNQKIRDSMKYSFSVTLEGQIVAIADEVTQRQHDLDDGMRDIKLGLKFEDVYKEVCGYISDILGSTKIDRDNRLYLDQLQGLRERLEARSKSSDLRYKRNALTRDIIEYFICDITLASASRIARLGLEKSIDVDNRKLITDTLIDFSDIGEKMNSKIEKYIKYRILNSYEVNRFDGKASYIIRQLFKAYYSNPRQMETLALEKLESLIDINSRFYEIRLKNLKDKDAMYLKVKDISFERSSPKEVDALISYLKMELDIGELIYPADYKNSTYCSPTHDELKPGRIGTYLKKDMVDQINRLGLEEIKRNIDLEEALLIKCMLEDHYAYLSIICDYISGMTDNFAKNEYSQLYLV